MTKRIIISLAMIALVIAGVTSATVAYFSDTATVSANTFSAGTMDLKIDSNPLGSVYDWTDGFPSNQIFANLKPGSTGEQVLDIKNVGAIDGYATIKLHRTSAWNQLPDNLVFTVYFNGNNDGTTPNVWGDAVVSGTLAQFEGNTYTLGQIVSASNSLGGLEGKMASVKIVWSVPTTAVNDIQGDSVTIDAVFGLEQVR